MSIRRRAFGLVVVGLLSLGPACKSSTDSGPAPCTEAVFISVTSGTTPTFSWDPPCLAYHLSVTDSVGNVMWGVKGDSGATLASGVQYGVKPAGAYTQLQAPVALLTGKLYAVGLYSVYTGSPTPIDVLGASQFRP